jgi:hypothetical protein
MEWPPADFALPALPLLFRCPADSKQFTAFAAVSFSFRHGHGCQTQKWRWRLNGRSNEFLMEAKLFSAFKKWERERRPPMPAKPLQWPLPVFV